MREWPSHWLCTNRFRLSLPDALLRALSRLLDRLDRLLGGRLPHSTWVRYELDLRAVCPASVERPGAHPTVGPPVGPTVGPTSVGHPPANKIGARTSPSPPSPEGAVTLSPIDEALLDSFSNHAWREHPQLRSARRLWDHGLRDGYLWRERGEPMCVQWLFTAEDNTRLWTLTHWSGMYPPLSADCAQVENIIVLPKGLRRRGGSATPFAYAVYEQARARGIERLVTHIKEDNIGACRWADRTGWTRYGSIRRYRIKAPLLQRWALYLHSSLPAGTAPAGTAPAAGAPPGRGAIDGSPDSA